MLGEEKEGLVRDIDCAGNEEDVFIKIRKEIDPFFLQTDDPENIKVSEEYDEEEKHRIQKGDFSDYCPVTWVE